MQSVITWGQLLIYLFVFLFFYYAVLGFVFYRRELVKLLKQAGQPNGIVLPSHGAASPAHVAPVVTDTTFQAVHELLEDLKPVFAAAKHERLAKEQVVQALQFRLRKYPSIYRTPFAVALNNHIEQELQSCCGMVLVEQELDALWS